MLPGGRASPGRIDGAGVGAVDSDGPALGSAAKAAEPAMASTTTTAAPRERSGGTACRRGDPTAGNTPQTDQGFAGTSAARGGTPCAPCLRVWRGASEEDGTIRASAFPEGVREAYPRRGARGVALVELVVRAMQGDRE